VSVDHAFKGQLTTDYNTYADISISLNLLKEFRCSCSV